MYIDFKNDFTPIKFVMSSKQKNCFSFKQAENKSCVTNGVTTAPLDNISLDHLKIVNSLFLIFVL